MNTKCNFDDTFTLHRNDLLTLGIKHSWPKETNIVVDDDTSSREEDNLETAAANELETQYISDSPNEKKRDDSDSEESEEDVELTSVHGDAHTS